MKIIAPDKKNLILNRKLALYEKNVNIMAVMSDEAHVHLNEDVNEQNF